MSREESRARTRALLLESAHRVFVERGYNAATIEEIATGAGFTRGAFYANFDDKLDAFWAVVEQEDAELFGVIEEALDASEAGGGELSVLDHWFERIVDGAPLQRAFEEVRAQPSASERERERMRALTAMNRRRIGQVVELQARARGVELGMPAERIGAVFLALADGLGAQHKLDPEAVPVSLIADAFACLWTGAAAVAADPSIVSRGSGTPSPPPPRPARRRS